MPKPGWTLETKTGPYGKTYAHFHNSKLSEGVTEVAWSGGNLANAFYDEFVFTADIATDLKDGETIYFPVVQQCERGVNRWIPRTQSCGSDAVHLRSSRHHPAQHHNSQQEFP